MKGWKALVVLAASAAALGLGSAARADDKPVLGLVMSFSGWFQPIDADTIAGAKLAVDDINAAGGILGQPIKIVEFDNKSEPPLGADGADAMGKGANAILFPSDFDFGAPGAFVAQKSNVLAFSAASDPKFGVKGVGPLAFSISNAGQAQGALMAEWAYKTKGWRKAYVLLDNTISYTKSLCGSFGERWSELAGADGLLGKDTFLNGDASVAAQITRITSLSAKPDVVFLCSYAPGGPSAIRQLRAAGVDAAILTGESMDGDYWIGSVPNLSNFYVVNYGSKYGDDPSADVNDFFKRFQAKYGKPADVSYGLRGYSIVQAWAKAANKAGSLAGDKVAAVLNTFNKEPLVIGPTTFTPTLHIETTRPMAIIGVKDGKFSAQGRFTVEKFPRSDEAMELIANGVTVRFGGLVATDNVTIRLAQDHVLGLIGPNGAGKTTLVNVLSGFQRPSSGRLSLGGRDITGAARARFAHLGVVRTFQAVRLFKGLSLSENVEVGFVSRGIGRGEARRRARGLLAEFDLADRADELATALSYGQQRRAGLARALALEPRFLLLDEPAAGLAAAEVDDLREMIGRIRKRYGCGVLVIEHNMALVMNLCDEIHVLSSGRTIASGTPAAIRADAAVRAAYLGSALPS